MLITGNLTFTSLSLSRLHGSPLLSSNSRFQPLFLTASKINLQKINTNFLYSTNSKIKSTISNSNFKQFTNSVVKVDSEYYSTKHYKTTFENQKENQEFKFEQCVFEKIRTNTNGGAISINSPNGRFFLKHCGFTICLASLNGGAIEFEGAQFGIDKTCFLGCLAVQSGQAMDLQGNNEFKGDLTYVSVQQCATARSPGTSQSIFLRHGNHYISSLNSSSNYVKDTGASLCIAYTDGLRLHFSSFIGNHGSNSFWLHRLRPSDELITCNIIKNSGSADLGLLNFENCTANINAWYFIENSAQTYFVSGIVTLNKCALDVRRSAKLIRGCQLYVSETVWGIKSLKSLPLSSYITWECWAMGSPSPTPSQSLVPIDHALEEAVLGVWVLFVIVAIGLVAFYATLVVVMKVTDQPNESELNLNIYDDPGRRVQ